MSTDRKEANDATQPDALPIADLNPQDLDQQSAEKVKGGTDATVGRANFDVFTCSKNIDTATTSLVR